MAGKYIVPVQLSLVVNSKNKQTARKAVRDIPWEDIIKFEYPHTGLMKEFVIRVEEQPKISKVKKYNGTTS